MANDIITLSVGGGGKAMGELINSLILRHFQSKELASLRDAAYLSVDGALAFATDSFVITPEFFPGGDIGKLAVAGTTNDLAVSGATPVALSCALIIPEGYSYEKLERVIKSMAKAALEAGVEIVTGDTKTLPKGDLKGLIINTAGIGVVHHRWNDTANIEAGDKIIITSDIARHGVAVFLAREELGFSGSIASDCNVLCRMLEKVCSADIRFARDATRGGVAAVLNEIALASKLQAVIDEGNIPISRDVADFCGTLGFDPLAVANEGVCVLVVSPKTAEHALELIRSHEYGRSASLCGEMTKGKPSVLLNTTIGGKRYVDMPLGEILPRIC